jgi:cytochrome c biogenesis protein CcmG, thiol:disulfide interchange protein DsbE
LGWQWRKPAGRWKKTPSFHGRRSGGSGAYDPRVKLVGLLMVCVVAASSCRQTDPPRVATIPADVRAVDAGPIVAIEAPAPEERDEPVDSEEKLPGGRRSIGKPAPGFTLDGALQRGAKVRLLKNKVTVIHFWATWCAPCMRSFVVFQQLHEKYADRGVVVIGLSVDDEVDGVADYARANHARFAIAWDVDHKVAELYQPQTMPSTYVIDRSGIVRSVIDGFHDADQAKIEETIKSLL